MHPCQPPGVFPTHFFDGDLLPLLCGETSMSANVDGHHGQTNEVGKVYNTQ